MRLYPNKEQEQELNKVLGAYRFVYNHMLAKKQNAYETDKTNLSAAYLSRWFYGTLRKDEQYAWLDGKFYIIEWNDGDEVRNFTEMFVYDKDKVLSLMVKKRPYSAYVSVENDEVYICMEFDGDNNVYRYKTKFREADLFTPENLWDKLD